MERACQHLVPVCPCDGAEDGGKYDRMDYVAVQDLRLRHKSANAAAASRIAP